MDITARAAHTFESQVEMADFLRFSPGSDRLAVCGSGGPLEIWDIGTRQRVHHNPTPCLAAGWASDGPIVSDGRSTWTECSSSSPLESFAAYAQSAHGEPLGMGASQFEMRNAVGALVNAYPRKIQLWKRGSTCSCKICKSR